MIQAKSKRAVALLLLLASTRAPSADLTPIGADAAANAEGTIPAWTGGLAESASTKSGVVADPFEGDRPAFVITAGNYRQYVGHLSAGHQALLAKYPDYAMSVYPTRRSVAFPDAVYQATAHNAKTARLRGADSIEGAQLGFPFREPKTGVELLWNHRLRYRGDSAEWHYARAVVYPNGKPDLSRGIDKILFAYANVSAPFDLARDNRHSFVLTALRPATGSYPDIGVLWHERVNEFAKEREVWTYGDDGKLFRNPPIGDDDVGMFSTRIRYWDMLDMFNGGFFRYTFKLLGKREFYVPYNSFKLADRTFEARELLQASHLKSNAPRYELHRVWIVEAVLRPGEHHSISRRVFYIDEDSWSILLVDCYDTTGRLTRFQEGHLLPLYSIRAVDYAPTVTYDLRAGRYFVDRLVAGERPPTLNAAGMGSGDFAPERLVDWYRAAAREVIEGNRFARRN